MVQLLDIILIHIFIIIIKLLDTKQVIYMIQVYSTSYKYLMSYNHSTSYTMTQGHTITLYHTITRHHTRTRHHKNAPEVQCFDNIQVLIEDWIPTRFTLKIIFSEKIWNVSQPPSTERYHELGRKTVDRGRVGSAILRSPTPTVRLSRNQKVSVCFHNLRNKAYNLMPLSGIWNELKKESAIILLQHSRQTGYVENCFMITPMLQNCVSDT